MLKTKAPPIHVKVSGPAPGPVVTDRLADRPSPPRAVSQIPEPARFRDDEADGTRASIDSPAFRHPTGLPSRVAFLTELQQLRGNAYVQQLVQTSVAPAPSVDERKPPPVESGETAEPSSADGVAAGPPPVMRRGASPPEPDSESAEGVEGS